jgi:flagellar biosynthesis protein FlhF
VDLARIELGEDALLINARPTTRETRHLGAYEVVFGAPPRIAASVNPGDTAAAVPPSDRLTQDVAGLRREIERLARCLGNAGAVVASAEEPELYARLVANELDATLALAVSQGTPLEDLFEADPTLGRPGFARSVVALVGPPGAGKTATLVKLAVRCGIALRKPVQIISADVYRIAAADQLRTLAGILGVGCDIVESPVALARAIEEHHSKELILIDTPGLAGAEMEHGADLAPLLATHPEVDTHLVLSASMKPADMSRIIEHYQVFKPKKLLFTHMDETRRYGALVNEAARHCLPVSFLATGQQIPDDLEPATKAGLAELILRMDPAETSKSVGATA